MSYEKYPDNKELIGGSPFGILNLNCSIIFSIISFGFPLILIFFFFLYMKELLLLNSHILSGFLPKIVYLPFIFFFYF